MISGSVDQIQVTKVFNKYLTIAVVLKLSSLALTTLIPTINKIFRINGGIVKTCTAFEVPSPSISVHRL